MSTVSVPGVRQDEKTADDDSPGGESGGGRWRAIAGTVGSVGSVLAGALLIAVHASLYGHWIMDDAAITFAYARNVAEGNGPVLQPGAEPVEGYSNPTWMLLLAVGKLLGLFDHGTIFGIPDYVLFPKALALVCCAGILTLFYVAVKPLTRYPRLVTLLAGAVLAAIPSFVIWSFSGLENSLYALVAVALAVFVQRAVLNGRVLTPKVALLAGVLVALAALTRPDGLIYLGAYPLVVLFSLTRAKLGASVRAVLLSILSFGVIFGSYVLWRWFEFHRLVANPVVAKAQKLPKVEDLAKTGQLIDYIGWISVVLVAGCVMVLVLRPSRQRAGLVPLLVTFGLAVAAYTIIAPDWMGEHRFASPVWALGAFIGAVAVTTVFSAARMRGRIVLAVVLVAATVLSVNQLYDRGKTSRASVKTPLCIVAERDGRTLNGLADLLALPRASAGVVDLGGQALTSRLDLVDLGGLGTARTADYVGAGDMPGMRDYIFTEVKPSFITTIGSWDKTIGFPDDPRFDRDYTLIFHGGPPFDGILYSYNNVGFWVRKELVPSEAKLRELRVYAEQRVQPILQLNTTAARRACGPVLARGQTS